MSYSEETEPVPRLAVLISVDQLRADYMERFRPWYVEGGFVRLLENGAVFEDCHYSFSVTRTAVGHTTIVTGASPDVHGVIGNSWIEDGVRVVSVEDTEAPLVGLPADAEALPPESGRSPHNILVPTVGDMLKEKTNGKSRVISISNKDRAAILMAGHKGDAYWTEEDLFLTSTYYRDALPDWLEEFNAEGRIDAYYGKVWNRLLDEEIYDMVQGPDDAPGESTKYGMGRTFPHVITGGGEPGSRAFYRAFDHSPYALEIIGDIAKEVVVQEGLGKGSATDLLCLGFSQIDIIGHAYGPDSHEMMDSMLRLDRILEDFFEFLDQEIGLENCLIVIVSDHGVSPIPEQVLANRPDSLDGSMNTSAGRMNWKLMDSMVEYALNEAYGPPPENGKWATRSDVGYYLHRPTLEERRVSLEDAAEVVKEALLKSPQVAEAYTRAEMLETPLDGDSLASYVRRSYHKDRSQDVVFIVPPYYVDMQPTGTNHGSPYSYDTHVPLLWIGPGVERGIHTERVYMESVAPTLAALLGVPAPTEGRGVNLLNKTTDPE